MKTIREAATDLCDRWDTKLWKDLEHTAVFIHELRMALAQPEDQQSCDKREWVGLSRDDVEVMVNLYKLDPLNTAFQIEAKLKELNHD